MADFVDLKSTYTLGHSSGVAALAAAAGQHGGLPAADVVALRRAGLLHDLGRTGVSTAIWDKPGRLSEREWEQVRMHPYYTERILARPAALARLGALGPEQVGGLSEREIEVLRLLARGQSNKQIAATLVISPKTAGHHIQHIYTKIGVSTRAGATLYALEHNLLTDL